MIGRAELAGAIVDSRSLADLPGDVRGRRAL